MKKIRLFFSIVVIILIILSIFIYIFLNNFEKEKIISDIEKKLEITINEKNNMYRAVDENRDQSYFLFNTTREQLNYLRFPLGGMLKN